MAAHQRSGAIGHFIDQVHTAGLVDGHFTVDQIGKRDGNGPAAGTLHYHVDEVLRKSIEGNPPVFKRGSRKHFGSAGVVAR